MNILRGQWPVMVFVLMFCVLPFATIPGLFDFVFIILDGFALAIVVLIVSSLFAHPARRFTVTSDDSDAN